MRSELLETINPSKNIVSSTYSSDPNILQTALYEINEAVDVSENLDDLYKSVHDTISKIMKADNFYIAIYYREEQKISFPYFVDEEEIFEEHKQKFDLGRGLTAYVIRSGHSMLCDLDRYQELVQSGELEVLGTPPRIWLGVPLKIGYEIIGVMAVQDYRDAATYGEQEKRMLEYVSSDS